MTWRRRAISLLLLFALLCSLMSTTVLAAGGAQEESPTYTVSLSGASSVTAGDYLKVRVLVTGTDESTTAYSTFSAVLKYDSSLFTYDANFSTLKGFQVTECGTGKLFLYYFGDELSVSNVDSDTDAALTLCFDVASTENTGTFSLEDVTVGTASNAENDTSKAAAGESLSVAISSTPSVAEPRFVPAEGEYDYQDSVVLECDTVGAIIYYKLNESATNWTRYTTSTSISLNDRTMVAYAKKTFTVNGQSVTISSSEVSATYTTKSYNLTDSSEEKHGTLSFYALGNYSQTVEEAKKNYSVTVDVAPDDGYSLSKLYITYADGETEITEELSCTITSNGDSIATFKMPGANVAVTAIYVVDDTEACTTFDLLAAADCENGKLTFWVNGKLATDTTELSSGTQVTIVATPNEGYALDKLTVSYTDGGETYTADITDEKTVTLSTSLQTVTAQFVKVYDITANTSNGSLVFYVGDESVSVAKEGEEVTVTATPDTGYVLDKLTYSYEDESGDTKTQDITEALSFTMPATAVTVMADFKIIEIVTEINNAADLLKFAQSVNNGGDYSSTVVKLNADLDLTNIAWTPIGTGLYTYYDNDDYHPFTGTFDGQGHIISGLSIEHSEWDEVAGCTGLFGYVSGATIQNLTVEGTLIVTSDFAAPTDYGGLIGAGGIVGCAKNSTISNCTNRMVLSINSRIASGGVVGYAYSCTLNNLLNYGTISSEVTTGITLSYIGGIVGNMMYGTMTQCGNYADISIEGGRTHTANSTTAKVDCDYCTGYVGGLVGNIYTSKNSYITESRNSGNISGDMRIAGGIVGLYSTGSGLSMSYCYNMGTIQEEGDLGNPHAINGRLAGLAGSPSTVTDVTIEYSYNYATVEYLVSISDEASDAYAAELHNAQHWWGSGTANATVSNSFTTAEMADDSNITTLVDTGYYVLADSGLPILKWEADMLTNSTATYAVTFTVSPETATVALYSDLARTKLIEPDGNSAAVYALKMGTYFYTISADGYVTETGTVTVSGTGDVAVDVTLRKAVTTVFYVKPSEAEFYVEDNSDNEVSYDSITTSGDFAVYTYTMYVDNAYHYNAYAEGYNSVTLQYIATEDSEIEVELTKKMTGTTIWGDENGQDEDHPYEITEGGTYEISEDAEGIIYIQTRDAVTLVGNGVGSGDAYENVYIDCTAQSTDLTLQDVYISITDGDSATRGNLIDFDGSGNTLNFAGTCILDMDSNASGYAMIHAGRGTELTITGGTAYMYKSEQGAGIGGNGGADTSKGGSGQAVEYNGTITISNATLFLKGSKQGAAIGAGAGAYAASGSPGTITIKNSELYLISNARGAAIGGSAGTNASKAGTINITDSTVTINVNWSGAGIGGGGYDGGNDADGGTLNVTRSSIRVYVDENGVSCWNVSSAGVNGNAAINTAIKTSSKTAYLLVFDTAQLSSSSRSFTVTSDGTTVYSGGLHLYGYVNESTGKYSGNSISPTYTMDNWVSQNDTCLYLYLTGEDHVLSVNGETFIAQFNGTGFDLVTSTSLYTTEVNTTTHVATTTIDSTALTAYLSTLSSGSQLLIDVTSEVGSKSVYESIVQMTPADAAAIGSAGVSLKIESPVADITLTAAGMKALGARTGDEVTIGASQESDGIHIDVAVDGTALSTITGGLTVTLPVSSVTKNTILVLVDEDGTETELTNAVFGTSSVTVQVSGSCVLKVTEKTTTIPSTTTIRNGLATTTIDSDALADILKLVEEGDQLLIEADISTSASRDVYSTITELDSDDVEAMADAEVSLLVSSFIADILLPTDALEDIAAEKGDTVTIIATEQTNGIAITVAVDGETMDKINGGIQVTLPVSNVTDNTVLVLINADGTENVLEDAVFDRYSVTAWVDGSCVLALREKSVELEVTTVIEDGVATTTIDSENLAAVLETIEAGTTLVITADIPDGVDVTEANTVLTRGDVRAMVEAEVDLKVSTPLADVVLSTQSLTSIAGDESLADEHEVVITTSERTSGTYIGVTVDGKTMGTVDGGILATLPAENASASSVLVLVDPYGEQTIIRKTALGDDALTALLSGSCTVKAIENPVYYADVTNTAWYTDAVAYVSARELFTGIGNDLFDPTGTMTRSMLVTVLHRLEDNPDAAQLSSYDDVAHDQWYSDAIHWADENGIVSGYGNGQFGTTDSVTREQMATILYRYVQYLGLDVSTTGSLSRFSDGGDTSDWAAEAMRWAVGAGILQGNDEGTLNPLGTASRAEVATMLQRLINLIVQ